jgi:hypothetical protein
VVPAILAALTVLTFATRRRHRHAAGLRLACCSARDGWQRGRMMQIQIDPQTHELADTSLGACCSSSRSSASASAAQRADASASLPLHVDPGR